MTDIKDSSGNPVRTNRVNIDGESDPGKRFATLVVDNPRTGYEVNFLRLSEHPGADVPLTKLTANILRVLPQCDGGRTRPSWPGRGSLTRAYRREFGGSVSAIEAQECLTYLVSAIRSVGLDPDLLLERNRKTRNYRLIRPLRVEERPGEKTGGASES